MNQSTFFIDQFKQPVSRNNGTIVLHQDLLRVIKRMCHDKSMPHLLIYGPSGSGKQVLIKRTLLALFGRNALITREAEYDVRGVGGRVEREVVLQNGSYLELNPHGTMQDRYIIKHIIEEYACTPSVIKKKSFRVVVLNNADRNSYGTQVALRRMMEEYDSTCRFILWCNNFSRIIDPLKSRCVCIRLSRPSVPELVALSVDVHARMMMDATLKEHAQLVKSSGGNVKSLLLACEYRKHGYRYTSSYALIIKRLVVLTISCKLASLKEMRELVVLLMNTSFDDNVMLRDLLDGLVVSCTSCSAKQIRRIVLAFAQSDHYITCGRHNVIHFERAFIAAMRIISDGSETMH